MSSHPESNSPDITILQDISNGHESGDDIANPYNSDSLTDLGAPGNHDGSSQYVVKTYPSPFENSVPGPSHRNDYLSGHGSGGGSANGFDPDFYPNSKSHVDLNGSLQYPLETGNTPHERDIFVPAGLSFEIGASPQGRVSTNAYDKEKNSVNFSAVYGSGRTPFGIKPCPTSNGHPVPQPPGPSVSHATVGGPGGVFASNCDQSKNADRGDTSSPFQLFHDPPGDPFARDFGAPYFTDDYPATSKNLQPRNDQDKNSGHGSHVTVPHKSSSSVFQIPVYYPLPVDAPAGPSHRNAYETSKSSKPRNDQDKNSGDGSHATVPHKSSSSIIRIVPVYHPPVNAGPPHRNDDDAQGFVDLPLFPRGTFPPPLLDPPFVIPQRIRTYTFPTRSERTEENGWDCNVCTYRNNVLAFKCSMCDAQKGSSAREEKELIEKDLKRDLEKLLKYYTKEEVLGKVNSMINGGHRDEDKNSDVEEIKANKPKNTARKSLLDVKKKNSISPTKTPLSPTSRKKGERKQKKQKSDHHTASDAEPEEKDDYHTLLALNDVNLVSNVEKFECPICFSDVEVGEGATLQECLHSFCKECLAGAVQFSETVVVKCPFRNDEYSCEFHLQEREVKALVTPEVYERHLQRSIALAESQAQDSFHCKTPNCPGWCLFEDNVNIFPCPVCNHTNCLTCGAIHEGMNCRQYQEDVAFRSDGSEEAKKTRAHLQNMLDNGEAMRCPQCRIFVMRKYGCDWMKCTMCHTEICWVTKGRRWGPGGRGDTSGGCRCMVNGYKCHPKCTHCH